MTETSTGTRRGRESERGCARETRKRGRREIWSGFRTELASTVPPHRLPPVTTTINTTITTTTTTPADLVRVDRRLHLQFCRRQPYRPCPERKSRLRPPPPPNPKDLISRKLLQYGGHIKDSALPARDFSLPLVSTS